MDFEQNNNLSEPPQPHSSSAQSSPAATAAPKRIGWRIFWSIFIVFSVLANIVLFLILVGVITVFATGRGHIFAEEIIQPGPRTAKIAVITLQGLIDREQAQNISRQLKLAREDKRVKGLILRVNSPGGGVSASDQIYNEILKFRQQTNKPVVAFMQGIAASGGYYASVGCDKIVAQPTTITGSIGVIMGHFVLQKLLVDKLGIEPVVIKSGPKKDWPSLFEPVTEEQRQYLNDKVIMPAYERFVKIVADGRAALSVADVKRLADGSIYNAAEALDEKLIDDIGYLDEAIELAKSLAGIEQAQVVEYRKPLSLLDLLASRSKSLLKIDRTTLYELGTPSLMYLWQIND